MNYGREEDYRLLAAAGVEVAGCVAVARTGGGVGRAAAVEEAERNGVVAVLVFSESDTWREGFERGHVMRGVGDPLSPGWGGVHGGERLGLEDGEVLRRFPKIPSLPLSFEAAEGILCSLGGAPLPLEWRGTIKYSKVRNVGPGPTVLDFSYQVGCVMLLCGWLITWLILVWLDFGQSFSVYCVCVACCDFSY